MAKHSGSHFLPWQNTAGAIFDHGKTQRELLKRVKFTDVLSCGTVCHLIRSIVRHTITRHTKNLSLAVRFQILNFAVFSEDSFLLLQLFPHSLSSGP